MVMLEQGNHMWCCKHEVGLRIWKNINMKRKYFSQYILLQQEKKKNLYYLKISAEANTLAVFFYLKIEEIAFPQSMLLKSKNK